MRRITFLFLLFIFFCGGCRTPPKAIIPVEVVAAANADLSEESLRQQAATGDVKAQITLAYRYETGTGTEKNLMTAAEWYILAAEQRDAEASYRLGLIYGDPDSPLYNRRSARAWLRRAVRLNHLKAKVLFYGPAR